jgi:integrase
MRLFDPLGPHEPSPADVQAWRRRKARERRASLTVGELVDRYLRHCVLRKVHSDHAHQIAVHYLGLFVRRFGPYPCIQLRPHDLTDFVLGNPSWKADNTRRQVAATVKAAFNWAVEEERVRRNPFRSVHFAESERKPEMTDDVWLQLCHAAGKPFEHCLRFLRYTGCREGELCLALDGDVDAPLSLWTVPIHKTRGRTKRPKVVELVPDALALVLAAAKPGKGLPCRCRRSADQPHLTNGHIFLNTRGRPWTPNTLQVSLIRLRDKVTFPADITLHSIRRRYATCGVAAGVSTELVAKNLGNDPQTCSKYYVNLSGQREAVRAAALLCQPPKK